MEALFHMVSYIALLLGLIPGAAYKCKHYNSTYIDERKPDAWLIRIQKYLGYTKLIYNNYHDLLPRVQNIKKYIQLTWA